MTFKMFVYKQVTNNPGSKQFVLIQQQKIIPVAYTLTTKYDPSSEIQIHYQNTEHAVWLVLIVKMSVKCDGCFQE